MASSKVGASGTTGARVQKIKELRGISENGVEVTNSSAASVHKAHAAVFQPGDNRTGAPSWFTPPVSGED